jgi:hypothetical protein
VADWYCSSAAHAAVPVFAVSTGYTVGQFVRRITSTPKAQWVMRCTVAGTSAASEPAWPTANNGTVVSGGATFANVTGQSAYGWSAAAGDIPTLCGGAGATRFAGGERIFVSSDHSETQATGSSYGSGAGASSSYNLGQVLSVTRAGSVPPVAADLTVGASVAVSGGNSLIIDTHFPTYHYGVSYINTGAAVNGIIIGSSGTKTVFLDACQLYINTASASQRIVNGVSSSLVLNNSTVRFGAATDGFSTVTGVFDITWMNTPSAIAGATIPTVLFYNGSNVNLATVRGVDLSAVTGTLVTNNSAGPGGKFLFDSCRIAPSVVRYSVTAVVNTRDLVELVNCYDGTNFISESWQPAGAMTTEFTITLSGGATDNVGTFSHKLVSNANIDKYANPLTGFWLDVGYATTGTSKTATVEIISSASLNNDEISLELEYLGTSSSSLASFATSLPATVLTAASAVTVSTATWNSSPATPQKQKLQVAFTPRTAGRLRARVRLGKASATVYYNPQVTIT